MNLKYLRLTVIVFYLLMRITWLGAQTVSKSPQLKNFLIERGTGHTCGSCPHITLRCDSVMDSHPGKGMMIEYHFGPDAVPQGGGLQTDYRTPYGDSILSWPFYLNMMMNRRDQGPPYGSTFIFGNNDNQIKKEADLIVTQTSEVNLSMNSSFNTTTRLLTVNVEAYYTANSATALNFLQVAITEDSLISMQYDGDYPLNNHFNPTFNHPNVFRANMNGFWGDSVKTTTLGTTITRTYTYTLPTTPYKWNANHCNLTLYATESKASSGKQSFAGKVITAIRAPIGGSAVSGIDKNEEAGLLMVYPNPSTGSVQINSGYNEMETVAIYNSVGQQVYQSSGLNVTELSVSLNDLPNGVYFIKAQTSKGVQLSKVVLQH